MRTPCRGADKIPAREVLVKCAFTALLVLVVSAGLAARSPWQGASPRSAERQKQVSKVPSISEDKRVKAESIDTVMSHAGVVLLDVREPKEIEELGGFEGSINIPVTQLEKRLGELPKDKTILTA